MRYTILLLAILIVFSSSKELVYSTNEGGFSKGVMTKKGGSKRKGLNMTVEWNSTKTKTVKGVRWNSTKTKTMKGEGWFGKKCDD